jgi:LuxR family maltose regulon positive regulatory protein
MSILHRSRGSTSAILARLGAHPVFEAADPRSHLPFPIVETKVAVPAPLRSAISRTALVNRLRAAKAHPVVTVVAPAGFGKTTLLAQWAERDVRRFAWVTVDYRDADPVVFLRHVAAALDRVESVGPLALDALRLPGESMWSAAVPRLTAAIAGFEEPFVLVFDDSHHLRAGDASEAVAALAAHLPAGSTIVLAGRIAPSLPIARLRADEAVLEIGPDELALTRREADLLLRNAGVSVSVETADELHRRTEGWAGALYLAALSLRDGPAVGGEAADDRYVSEYLELECFSHLTPERMAFLRRTSVLERLSPALCNAVLATRGSGAELAAIEASNLFLLPLDGRRDWYRYHGLFRDLLQRELTRLEPELEPTLNARASEWFEAHGDLESALDHADAAGDVQRTARLLASVALPMYYSGRVTTLGRWFERFDDDGLLEQFPAVAVHGAAFYATTGRPQLAERWLAAAARSDGTAALPDGSYVAAVLSVLRAMFCHDGVARMLADAGDAVAGLPDHSPWRCVALLARGVAHALRGEGDQADAALAFAADAAAETGFAEMRVVALVERALVAEAAGDLTAAEAYSADAAEVVHDDLGDGFTAAPFQLAVAARLMLRHGRWDVAREHLDLAIAFVTLRDPAAARAQLAAVDEILQLRRDLGLLAEQAQDVRREVDAIPVGDDRTRTSRLTGAELRLLPLLATHLSFREIAERLFVSRNTIKTQAISVYRKLGVSTRSQAIARSVELGLIEGSVDAAFTSPQAGDAAAPRMRSNGPVDDRAASRGHPPEADDSRRRLRSASPGR